MPCDSWLFPCGSWTLACCFVVLCVARQELRGISVDCDSDAVKFTVWQHGSPPAFCHFNR